MDTRITGLDALGEAPNNADILAIVDDVAGTPVTKKITVANLLSGIEANKGNTITVAKSGGDYDTIQAAIDASASGDTILIYDGTYSENVITKAGAMTTLAGVGTMGSVIIESNSGNCLTVPSAMMTMAFIKNLKLKSTATGNNASKLFYGEGTMTTFKDVSFDYNISDGYTEEIIDLEAGSYVFSNCRFDYDSIGTNGGTNTFISASGSVNYNVMQGYGTMSIASISSAEHLHFIGDSSSNNNLIRDFDCTIEATSASYGGHLDFIHSTNAGNIESLGNKIAITTPSGVAGSYGQAYHLAGSGGGHIHSSSNNIEIIGFGNDYIGNINATETLYSHFDDIVAEDNIIGDGTYSYANSPSNGDLQMSGNIIKKLLNITTDYDETESWEFGILSANSSTTDITATLNPTYFADAPSGATKTFINAGSTHNFILDPNGATWGGSTLPRVIYPGGYIILERVGSEGIIISSHNTSFNIEIADIDNPSFHVDFSDESSVTVDGSNHITQVVDSVNSWNGTPSSATGVEYGITTQNGLKTAKWDTNNTPLSFGDNDINNNTAGRGMTIIAVVKANNSNDAIMSKYYDATPQREWRFYTSNITIYNNLNASGNEAIINYSSNYGEWEILQIEWAPGEGATAYKNGFLLGTSSYDVATIPSGTANLLMGASDLVGADFSGEIGEIWAFSDTITKDEREAVTSKLGAKWDIDVATPSSSDSSPFGRNSDTETIKPLIDNDNLDIGTGTFSAGEIDSSSIYEVSKEGLVLGMNFNSENITGSAGSETVLDSSTYNNHGTNSGATHDPDGGFNGGGAFSFDGSNDYIYNNTIDMQVKSGKSLTVSLLLKPHNSNEWFFSRYSGSGDGLRCRINAESKANCYWENDGSLVSITSSTAIPLDEWNRIVFVFTSTNWKVYNNGELIGETSFTERTFNPATGFNLGRAYTSSYAEIEADNLQIYNRALSADEIKALYLQRAEVQDSFVSKKNVFVDSDSNVGIGTDSPDAPLHIYTTSGAGLQVGNSSNGTIKIGDGELTKNAGSLWTTGASGITAHSGSASVVSLGVSSGLNTGFFGTANSIGMSIAGTEKVTINSDGNVGIGTTSPGAKLEISDAMDGSPSLKLKAERVTGAPYMTFADQTTGRMTIGDVYGNGEAWVYSASADLNLGVNGAEAITIKSDLSVGIGTTDPKDKLHIKDSGGLENIGLGGVYSSGMGWATSYLGLNAVREDSSNWHFGTETLTNGGGVIYAKREGHLSFATIETTGGSAKTLTDAEIRSRTRMTIDSSGNVGIGTTSPGAKLDVNQTDGDYPAFNGVWNGDSTNSKYGYVFKNSGSSAFTGDGASVLINNVNGSDTAKALSVVSSGTNLNSTLVDIVKYGTGTGRALTVTNAGTDNGLLIDQNGDGVGLFVDNAGNEHGIRVTQSGVLASGQRGLYVYSAAELTNGAELVKFYTDNPASTDITVEIRNDGTGDGLFIDKNNSGYAQDIDGDANSDNDLVGLRVNVANTGAGDAYSAIFQTGNVGIGTTAPLSLLDTKGEARFGTYQVDPLVRIVSSNSGSITDTTAGSLIFSVNKNNVSDLDAPRNAGISVFTGSDDRYTNLAFHTSDNSGGATNMIIDSTGNVGIGTTSPDELLSIMKDDNDTSIMIGGGPTNDVSLIFSNGNIAAPVPKTAIVSSGIDNWRKADLVFVLDSAGDGDQYDITTDTKMIIKNDGNVGIGTTSPDEKLDVAGNIAVSGTVDGVDIAAEETRLAGTSGTNTGDQDLSSLALKSNVLELDNTDAFTPDADYEPATKKYVDDNAGGSDMGINVETLTANKTLTAGTDDVYQYLNTGEVTRTITLDTASASNGDRFIIRNNSVYYDDISSLSIKQSTTTIDTLYAGRTVTFIYDGTNWIGVYEKNVQVGKSSKGYGYGVAVGDSSTGATFGTAVGFWAMGNNLGTALGYMTRTSSNGYAVALGAMSISIRTAEIAHSIDGDDNNITIGGWSGSTSNATPTEIFCGGATSERFTIQASSVLSFKIQVTARDNTSGDVAVYHLAGAIKRDGSNNTALVGDLIKEVIAEEDSSWDVAVTADDTNEALIITVTGDAINTVQWAARLDGVETHF